jgi:hypothetical protein
MSDDAETLVLTADERRILIRLVRRAIDDDRYPLAPRLDPLKAILAKLDAAPPRPPPPRPLPSGGTLTWRGRRR